MHTNTPLGDEPAYTWQLNRASVSHSQETILAGDVGVEADAPMSPMEFKFMCPAR